MEVCAFRGYPSESLEIEVTKHVQRDSLLDLMKKFALSRLEWMYLV